MTNPTIPASGAQPHAAQTKPADDLRQRCNIALQLLPEAEYKTMLSALFDDLFRLASANTQPMDYPPLPTRACFVTNVGDGYPHSFMLSMKRGVALMQQPVGSTLDLFAADQLHAYLDEYRAQLAARKAPTLQEVLKQALEALEISLDFANYAAEAQQVRQIESAIASFRALIDGGA